MIGMPFIFHMPPWWPMQLGPGCPMLCNWWIKSICKKLLFGYCGRQDIVDGPFFFNGFKFGNLHIFLCLHIPSKNLSLMGLASGSTISNCILSSLDFFVNGAKCAAVLSLLLNYSLPAKSTLSSPPNVLESFQVLHINHVCLHGLFTIVVRWIKGIMTGK